MERRVALMVDGDNVGPCHAGRMLQLAQGLGRVDMARVYGAANCASAWLTVPGFRFIYAGSGKNAADLLLSIDAIEMTFQTRPDAFVIASSDSDFTHLAVRLREKGLHVCGIGEAKAKQNFRAACSEFVELCQTVAKPEPTPRPVAAPLAPFSDLDRHIRATIALHSKKGEGMLLTDLAPVLHKNHGVSISTLPDANWRGYFTKRPDLYDIEPRGQQAKVRFKPAGFAAPA